MKLRKLWFTVGSISASGSQKSDRLDCTLLPEITIKKIEDNTLYLKPSYDWPVEEETISVDSVCTPSKFWLECEPYSKTYSTFIDEDAFESQKQIFNLAKNYVIEMLKRKNKVLLEQMKLYEKQIDILNNSDIDKTWEKYLIDEK